MPEDRRQLDQSTSVVNPSTIDQEPVAPVRKTLRPATANAVSSGTSHIQRLSQRRASLSEKRHFELINNGQLPANGSTQMFPVTTTAAATEDIPHEVPSPPVIVDHQQPVSTLRKYYTELDASTQVQPESSTQIRRTSYTLTTGSRFKAKSVPNVDSVGTEFGEEATEEGRMPVGHYDDRVQRHAASVEELRQIFERGEFQEEPERDLRPSMRRQGSFQRYPSQTVPSNMSKSVEFFSRPPKYRTPSPRTTNLPTPPPLPLPPSSPECTLRADGRSFRQPHVRSKNYVTRFNQCAQPIVSMHMPFRSRSLALDRSGCSSEMLQARPRTGSITQRSVSPLPTGVTTTRGRSRRKHVTHSSRTLQKPVGTEQSIIQPYTGYSRSRQQPRRVVNKGTQSVTQTIIPSKMSGDVVKVPETDVIRLSPADTDGVYVRSAVVYERVADQIEVNGQRHFVTTYVISQGPSPSRSTVQATNLWVAEQALLSAGGSGDEKSTTLPPYRTQPLSRLEQEFPSKPTDYPQTPRRGKAVYSSCRVPARSRKVYPRPRSLSAPRRYPTGRQSVEHSPEPAPLPTPPPADMHRYLLRCSSQDASLDKLDQKTVPSGADKAVQWDETPPGRPRKQRSTSPARSWSVRSLSPPPFRTPWLSSMGSVRSKRSTSKSPFPQGRYDGSTEPLMIYEGENGLTDSREPLNHQHPCFCAPCARRQMEIYELDRARQREARARQEWVRRAETVRRERHDYHRIRGSWSPPELRSPARNTPNNLEEQTEREIRYRIRQHKPLSPVPLLPMPTYPTVEPEQPIPIAVDEAVQCDQPMESGENPIDLNVDTGVASGEIDTTPITENFDGKRAYFEELIRTNKLMARCSFCSDCYHCPHGQVPRLSCCSSWDSEVQQNCSPLYTQGTTAIPRTDHTKSRSYSYYRDYPESAGRKTGLHDKPFQSRLHDSYDPDLCEPHRVYKVESIHEPSRYGPQQYASSLCLTSYPNQGGMYQQGVQSRTDKQSLPVCQGHSIQHDYYARPQMAMPKVAPNPPPKETSYTNQYYKWTRLGTDRNIQPSRAELIHSPTATTTNFAPRHSTYYSRDCPLAGDDHHSPGCRFYDGSRGQLQNGDSWDSLNAAGNDFDAAYRGRVKQIVCELNERAMQDSHVIDETYPAYSTPDLRRSLRYN